MKKDLIEPGMVLKVHCHDCCVGLSFTSTVVTAIGGSLLFENRVLIRETNSPALTFDLVGDLRADPEYQRR